MEIIDNKKEELSKICKKYHVSLLFVFGSILTSKFNKGSDIDFVVYFEPLPVLEYADNFFDFLHELENLFQRKIDLVSGNAMKNPVFIEEIEQTKQLVYGERDKKVIG